MSLSRNDYERSGADEDAELTYTFFLPDGLLTLTEHELVNGFMQMRTEVEKVIEPKLREQVESYRGSSQAEKVRCDHPGCESRSTQVFLVGLGGMFAWYCVDHQPPLPPYDEKAERFIRKLVDR